MSPDTMIVLIIGVRQSTAPAFLETSPNADVLKQLRGHVADPTNQMACAPNVALIYTYMPGDEGLSRKRARDVDSWICSRNPVRSQPQPKHTLQTQVNPAPLPSTYRSLGTLSTSNRIIAISLNTPGRNRDASAVAQTRTVRRQRQQQEEYGNSKLGPHTYHMAIVGSLCARGTTP